MIISELEAWMLAVNRASKPVFRMRYIACAILPPEITRLSTRMAEITKRRNAPVLKTAMILINIMAIPMLEKNSKAISVAIIAWFPEHWRFIPPEVSQLVSLRHNTISCVKRAIPIKEKTADAI
jgi:hypothetical protein